MGRNEKRGAHKGPQSGYTDQFLMQSYKVIPCGRRYPHDWASCPCGHKGERAARRDLRTHPYVAIACSYAKQKLPCPNGDACPWAHNLFEYWLHPSRYRTEMCQYGSACERPVCFFAHTLEELRVLDESLPPAELCWSAGAATTHGAGHAVQRAVAAAAAQQQQQQQQQAAAATAAMLGMGDVLQGTAAGGQLPTELLLQQLQLNVQLAAQQQEQQRQEAAAAAAAVAAAVGPGMAGLDAASLVQRSGGSMLQPASAAMQQEEDVDGTGALRSAWQGATAVNGGCSFTTGPGRHSALAAEGFLTPQSVLGANPALDTGASRSSSFSTVDLHAAGLLTTAPRSSSITLGQMGLARNYMAGDHAQVEPRASSFTPGMPLGGAERLGGHMLTQPHASVMLGGAAAYGGLPDRRLSALEEFAELPPIMEARGLGSASSDAVAGGAAGSATSSGSASRNVSALHNLLSALRLQQ